MITNIMKNDIAYHNQKHETYVGVPNQSDQDEMFIDERASGDLIVGFKQNYWSKQ